MPLTKTRSNTTGGSLEPEIEEKMPPIVVAVPGFSKGDALRRPPALG
jgi:hypothetical protein